MIPPEHRRLLSNYRMPPEWAPHIACYLVWPHNPDTWPGKFEVIPPIYAQMVASIAQFEPVRLIVKDAGQIRAVLAMVRDAAAPNSEAIVRNVEAFYLPTNDSWARDHGPIFVNRIAAGAGPAQIALDWRFNSISTMLCRCASASATDSK
jgi:agmatine deiminase